MPSEQGRDGVLFTSCGGLTKLEHAAIELAKGRANAAVDFAVPLVVETARAILAECDRVQKEMQSQQQSGTLQE